jgi:phosphatidate phosphatase PAH1
VNAVCGFYFKIRAHSTLWWVVVCVVWQGGETLPDGPLIMSPDGITTSLYREVIRKTPHEFKIASLQTIRELFPEYWNPFYAGFGNRETDERSYKAVQVQQGKIFTINPSSQVTPIPVQRMTRTRASVPLSQHIGRKYTPVCFS